MSSGQVVVTSSEQHLRFCPRDKYGSRELKSLPQETDGSEQSIGKLGLKNPIKRMKTWDLVEVESGMAGHP